MALPEDFEAAQNKAKTLKATPTSDELLELYGLYKQAKAGNVTGSRPSLLDFKGRAKYDAWQKRSGMTQDQAMNDYIALVEKLAARYG